MGVELDLNDKKKKGSNKKQNSQKKNGGDERSLEKITNSAPSEHHNSKDILDRVPVTLRGNRQLWAEFGLWCTMNRTSRSDVIENFVLEKLGKTKDDYR